MRTLLRSAIRTKKVSKAISFLPVGFLTAIIILGCMGFIVRFGLPNWQPLVDRGSRLAADISSFFTKKIGQNNQGLSPELGEEIKEKEQEGKVQRNEGKPEKYLETAAKGEGLTHLARRALRSYLKDHPSSFHLTPEHKVYIEDYLAKKKGGGWLRLGQKVEFSQDLIKEAIEMSEQLTPSQLENLKQYSQLVPTLNY
ncbi:hypothetical protein J7J18_01655 [bacterium]|nr:hypothetical protein [bacterium]